MRRSPLLLLAIAAALAGCGGGGGDNGSGGDTPQGIFAANCGSCHTLAAAGTEGQVGPNLDDLAPDVAQVQSAIAEGPGSMQSNILEGDRAEQVAAYVANSAGD